MHSTYTDTAINQPYFTEQIITYIGNKRALLDFIKQGINLVQDKLQKEKLSTLDVFSGSGIVSRYLKNYSSEIYANDLELYARTISQCYLSNPDNRQLEELFAYYETLRVECARQIPTYLEGESKFKENLPGFISELYAPKDIDNIQSGERCFYTPHNACYIDCMRQLIAQKVPQELQHYFIAPLLAEASIHANTGGVFKGFYKNSHTGIGKFGGNGANALTRITGHIELPFPIFSQNVCPYGIFNQDANTLYENPSLPDVDLAYIDPPYNQHPYGSNYFMLNLITSYEKPVENNISRVSGIPKNWNRSLYNKKKEAVNTFAHLVENLRAKYLLISFNNEGYISQEEMVELLSKTGTVTTLESPYNAYRASRNLSSRNIHVKEYLYVVQKK